MTPSICSLHPAVELTGLAPSTEGTLSCIGRDATAGALLKLSLSTEPYTHPPIQSGYLQARVKRKQTAFDVSMTLDTPSTKVIA